MALLRGPTCLLGVLLIVPAMIAHDHEEVAPEGTPVFEKQRFPQHCPGWGERKAPEDIKRVPSGFAVVRCVSMSRSGTFYYGSIDKDAKDTSHAAAPASATGRGARTTLRKFSERRGSIKAR